MIRSRVIGLMVVTLSLASFNAPALGQSVRDDQIPWGPDGTIGRGTDSAFDRKSGWRYEGGSWYLPSAPSRSGGARYEGWAPTSSYSRSYHAGSMESTPRTVARPYLTNQHYEPGDGYRYPLYFNPATGGYFYYPVRR